MRMEKMQSKKKIEWDEFWTCMWVCEWVCRQSSFSIIFFFVFSSPLLCCLRRFSFSSRFARVHFHPFPRNCLGAASNCNSFFHSFISNAFRNRFFLVTLLLIVCLQMQCEVNKCRCFTCVTMFVACSVVLLPLSRAVTGCCSNFSS